MDSALAVRDAIPDDADAVCAVPRRSITMLCGADHQGDERILEAWLRNKTPQNVCAWLASSNLSMVVALHRGLVCGVAMISRQGEIQLCYVEPEVRFLGAGRLMLKTVQERALEWGLSDVFLTSTVTGKPFYERNGFTAKDVRVRSESSAIRYVYPMVKHIGCWRTDSTMSPGEMRAAQIRLLLSHELQDLLILYRDLHRADVPLPAEAVVDRVWNEIS